MTMTKKRLIVVAGMAAFGGLVLGVLAILPGRPRLTGEQYAMIQDGMSLKGVETVLGCTPGDYSLDGGLIPDVLEFTLREQKERSIFHKDWAADSPPHENEIGHQNALAIRVWFDE